MIGEWVHVCEMCFFFFLSTWGGHPYWVKNFFHNVNFSRTMQNWFWRDFKNQKVTPARGGENWFPHDNRDTVYSFFSCAVSQNIFVYLPSLFGAPPSFKVEMLRPKKNKKKKTAVFSTGLIEAGSHNEPNHSEAKMEILASELIRQGIARPK